MTNKQFSKTLDLLSGKAQPNELLKELQIWARDALRAEVYNYFCNRTLTLVLWDYKAHNMMLDGTHYDKAKQKAVAEKFSELAKLHQVHCKYWDAKDISVCYDTLCDGIRSDIFCRIADEINDIQHPDIQQTVIYSGRIHIFYETDEQIVRNGENGTSDEIKCRFSELIKPHDVYNAFPDGADCIFTSRQTLDEKFDGKLSNYYCYYR